MNSHNLGNMDEYEPGDLQKASGAKYETLEELREARQKVNFWTKLKLTWQGKTKVGKITGTALDIAELFAPSWAVKTRDVIQTRTKPNNMKSILKRTFTTDGGSFFRVRNEDGEIDLEAAGASLLRGALIVGVLYLAKVLGVLEIATKIFGIG